MKYKKRVIFLLSLVVLAGCGPRYAMDGARCRDAKTGQYVPTTMCEN